MALDARDEKNSKDCFHCIAGLQRTRALTAHRLRSFLTLLGIAAVILLTSIGEGIHRFVLAEFTQFGTNVVSISPGKTKTAGPAPTGIPTSVRPLTLDDARALERLPHVTGMTATVWGNTEVNANGCLRRTTVNGVSADMPVPALPVHTPITFVILAEGIAVSIGLLAGVLPARRAARLDPVEALRAE